MSINIFFLKIIYLVNIVNGYIIASGGDFLEEQLTGEFDKLTNPKNIEGEGVSILAQFVQNLVNIAIPIAIISCIFLLVFAGYKMITSQGNPEKIAEAKEIITNALSGFALIVLSTVILILINNTLKLGIPY